MKVFHVRLISTSLILILLLSSIAAMGLHPWSVVYAAGTISGTVFADYNSDGIRDANESGLGGITVTAYDSAGVVRGITTSDPTGSYTLNATGTGPYRIEFSGWPAYLQPAHHGTGNGTSVQFVPDGTSTNVNFGLHNPAEYCQDNPNIATSCYSNGDPLGDNTGTYPAANLPALVQIPFVPGDPGPNLNDYLATGAQVGATWGLTYQRSSQTLLAATVVRRHSGFGPGGIGAIYAVDPSGGTAPSVLLDLNTAGYPAGTGVGTLDRPDLPADSTETNHDTDAFDAVGKRGIGGISLSEDEETLWVMNLFSRSLLEIRVGVPATAPAAADIIVHPFPTPNCNSGVFRAWAVKTYRGQVYIGGVCSGERELLSDPLNANADDLQAYIYRHNPAGAVGNFTLVSDFSLNYPRGFISTDEDFPPPPPQATQSPLANWLPWINEWDDIGPPMPLPGDGPFGQTMYPQPMLTAIEFDADGSMVLGLLDRAGMQLGNENFSPIPGDTALHEGVAAGDILRLCVNPAGGYVLENNGVCPGGLTGTGSDNNQGPGGGEFFGEDDYILSGNPLHQEVTLGGLALHPGRREVVSTAYDPVREGGDLRSGGFRWFNTTDGTLDRSYLIFGEDEVIGVSGSGTPRTPSSMGKAAGLGDVELLCDQAPIQIGNRVWLDLNGNGIQDPDEEPIEGVRVELWRNGTLIGFTTTDVNGEYYFNDLEPRTGTPGSDSEYEIRIPADQPTLDELIATRANADPSPNGDSRDSNGTLDGTNVVYRIPYGDLASAGYNNHTYDFGFTFPASLGDYVWEDLNRDGIQDDDEPPVAGVRVILRDAAGNPIRETTTDDQGYYIFDNLTPGIPYQVEFELPDGYQFTLPRQGTDDERDSDADPDTGRTRVVELAPGEHNPRLDAGLFRPASLGDYVWEDRNRDGIQDDDEPPVVGVRVILRDAAGNPIRETTTDDQGYYIFDNLTPGIPYQVEFVLPDGYQFTLPQQGTDDERDSDADPDTGRTRVVELAPGEHNPRLDAGLFRPASLGDYVWEDRNRDGIQDDDEPPVAGVRVILRDAAGNPIRETTTDDQGYYFFGDLVPGSYQVEFELPDGYQFTLPRQGTDDERDSDADPDTGRTRVVELAPGEHNPRLDAGLFRPTSLGDYVWEDRNRDGIQDDDEPPVVGVRVILRDAAGNPIRETTTDDQGYYFFGDLLPGSYQVEFELPDGYQFTLPRQGTDDERDSDADPDTGRTRVVELAPGEHNPRLDAGLFRPASLDNRVWLDTNRDGIQDDDEPGVPGIIVRLLDGNGNPVRNPDGTPQTVTTDAEGRYQFTNLPPGTYQVEFVLPPEYAFTLPNQGDDNTRDSDADPNTGRTSVIRLRSGEENRTLDAGIYRLPVLGNLVWEDSNNNGVVDPGETGVPGVTVQLYRASGDGQPDGPPVAETITDMNGNYRFSGMPAGEYIVEIVPPESYRSSTGRNGHEAGPYEPGYAPGVDGNPARRNVDHGTEVRPGLIRSNPITFTPDGDPTDNGDLTIDFGIFRPASLGNVVWHDQNNNGRRDPGEPGISGVTVTLYDQDGNIVATTTTDGDGNYLFTHLTPGIYQVGFDLPEGYDFTIPGQGDPATDSNVDPDTRRTGPITIGVGQNELSIWAGLVTPDPADIPDPTAITLNRFTATREGGRVVIRWETGVERNTWGYQLYRATSRDRAQATRITPTIILARGRGTNGAAYTWHDIEASDTGDYWYWLEEVEIDGTTSIHGPIRISTQTATTTFKVFLPLTVR